MLGWQVCRMHCAGGGAHFGAANGAWVHGGRSKTEEQDKRNLMALLKLAKDAVNGVPALERANSVEKARLDI